MNKQLYLLAFLITCFLLATLLIIGGVFDSKREEAINALVQDTYNNLNEMQTFMLMSEIYGDEMACLAFQSKLLDLDKTLWELGIKLDRYRTATEQFQKDPFYLAQKRVFNENEVFYLMLLTKVNAVCGHKQDVISYFYRNAKDCGDCDAQSFVLSDIKRDVDQDISIFSFDAELDLASIGLLTEFYGVDAYPCVIINEEKFCGLRDKDFVVGKICETSDIAICPAEPAEVEPEPAAEPAPEPAE